MLGSRTGEGVVRELGMDMYTLLYLKWVTDGPTVRPTVQHRELCSMLRGSLDGRGVWGRMDTCMPESPQCSPQITTTLLISYTPIQNKKLKKKQLKKQIKTNISASSSCLWILTPGTAHTVAMRLTSIFSSVLCSKG